MQLNEMIVKYGPLVEAITAAIAAKPEGLSDEAKAGNKEKAGTLADSIKAYAKATHDDGTSVEDATKLLRLVLAGEGHKPGTILNYGHAVGGFRKILEEGGEEGLKAAGVKDAQRAMRDDATVAKDTLREAIKPYLRDATAEQLEAVLEACKASGIVVKERKVRSDKAGPVVDVTAEVVAEQAREAA